MLIRSIVVLALSFSVAALGADCQIETIYLGNGKVMQCMTCCESDDVNCSVQCF